MDYKNPQTAICLIAAVSGLSTTSLFLVIRMCLKRKWKNITCNVFGLKIEITKNVPSPDNEAVNVVVIEEPETTTELVGIPSNAIATAIDNNV